MIKEAGFLIIDKPGGITSHDVVAKIRKRFATKQVGHAGTLDPMATGVLVIGVGSATKFLQYILSGTKRYLATIRLGIATDTDDREGSITSKTSTAEISDEVIRSEMNRFLGLIIQVPSKVSAIKVDGKRAYDLVRAGQDFELKSREVEIKALEILSIRRGEYLDIDIDVTCSAGTYIRAIARDLGERLGVGGHLIALRRTLVAPFSIESAGGIEDSPLLPLANSISQILPIREISVDEARELRFGRFISQSDFDGVGVALIGSEVIAIIENRDGMAKPMAVFNS